MKFFENTLTVLEKNKEIERLWLVNGSLKGNLIVMERNIADLKNYTFKLNSYDRFANIDNEKLEFKDTYGDIYALNDKLNISDILDRGIKDTQDIYAALDSKINGLENFINKTGLKDKNIFNVSFNTENKDYDNSLLIKNNMNLRKNLLNKVQYISYLEKLINEMPLSPPMKDYRLTSRFGYRKDPFLAKKKSHNGLDFAGAIGSKVQSSADGEVIFSGSRGGFGNSISIRHNKNLISEYAHLRKVLVKKGDIIKRGQDIGIQGNTGRSTGSHLHYEVHYKNKPIDPENFLTTGYKIY